MTIMIRGLDAALRQVNPQRLQRAIGEIVMAVALEAQHRIAPYPPQTHAKQPFKTAKQRRAFFAKLRAGEIEVPYRRGSSPGSETMGRRWRIRQAGEMRAVLENTASYADLVHGATMQTAYMRAEGWKTDDGIAAAIQSSGVIDRIAGQVLVHVFGG